MKNSIRFLALILILFSWSACSDKSSDSNHQQVQESYPLKIYLVRHAEKETGPNPVLTARGIERAEALRDLLKDSSITEIYSTDYKRTIQTANPLAEHLAMEISIYQASDLDSFRCKIAKADREFTCRRTQQYHSSTGGKIRW